MVKQIYIWFLVIIIVMTSTFITIWNARPTYADELNAIQSLYTLNKDSYNIAYDLNDSATAQLFTYAGEQLPELQANEQYLFDITFNMDFDYATNLANSNSVEPFAFDINFYVYNTETQAKTLILSNGYTQANLITLGYANTTTLADWLGFTNIFINGTVAGENDSLLANAIYNSADMVTAETYSPLYNQQFFTLLARMEYEYSNNSAFNIAYEPFFKDGYGVTLNYGFDLPQYIATNFDYIINNTMADLYASVLNYNFIANDYFINFNATSSLTTTYGVYDNVLINCEINANVSGEKLGV